ncbi:hypothetical protein ACJJTC_006988 [Scirpophaga incertulas]
MADIVREGKWKAQVPSERWVRVQKKRIRNRFVGKRGNAELLSQEISSGEQMESWLAGDEEGMAEGRSEMASGNAERAHSCEAPRVDPTERYLVHLPRLWKIHVLSNILYIKLLQEGPQIRSKW